MLIIGHRGCSYSGYNQNTIRSYKKIIDQGAKAFEFDVQITKDNELVVVHNLDLTKVSDGSGLVAEKTLKEIKNFHAGSISNGLDSIPTLTEVLDMASSYKKEDRAVLHLELKGDNTGELSGKLVKSFIDANKLDSDDFLISSFNWAELEEMRKVVPTLKIALLDGAIRRKELAPKLESDESIFSEIFAYGEEDYMLPFSSNLEEAIDVVNQKVKIENDRKILVEEVKKALTGQYYDDSLIEAALNMKAFSINLWFKTVSKEYIEKAHKKGLKVFLFTVNEKKDIDSVKDLNPDGIFTDYYLDTKTYYESLNT